MWKDCRSPGLEVAVCELHLRLLDRFDRCYLRGQLLLTGPEDPNSLGDNEVHNSVVPASAGPAHRRLKAGTTNALRWRSEISTESGKTLTRYRKERSQQVPHSDESEVDPYPLQAIARHRFPHQTRSG
jgi:hypothetical protein